MLGSPRTWRFCAACVLQHAAGADERQWHVVMQAMLHPAYAVTSLQAALLMAAATGLKESDLAVLKTPPIVNVEGPGRSCSQACMTTSKLMWDMRMHIVEAKIEHIRLLAQVLALMSKGTGHT